ncbi:MAG: hypothetical protein JO255_07810, partial [Alphaproteobacteria bacterium]|nr:hypothetical protein [Alphaproteobacteria bacterium]
MLGSKLSIRVILGLVIGVMGLLLVVASTVSLVGAADRYGEARSIAALAPISGHFFKALSYHRLERGNVLTALKAEAPADASATADIATNRRIVEEGYAGGMKLVAGIDLKGVPEAVAQLKAAQERVEALRPKVDAALRQKAADRDPSLVKDWPVATQTYLDTLEGASHAIEESMLNVDPRVDQIVTIKRAAWATRTHAGAAILRLLTGLSSG